MAETKKISGLEFALRTLGAVAILYVFMISIMVGTAQQGIVEGLKAKNIDFDYNVAVRHYLDPDRLLYAQQAQAQVLGEARTTQSDLQSQLTSAERQVAIGFQTLQGDLRILAQAGCTVGPGEAPPQGDGTAILAAASTAVACVQQSESAANPQLVAVAQRTQERGGQLEALMEPLQRLRIRVEGVGVTVNALAEKHSSLSRQIEQAARSNDVMAGLEVLKKVWPARMFIALPPALMGIMISFTSGLFGAQLITLILVVYPGRIPNAAKTDIYWTRLFVGGLVALGVFVMLFSGVAVLNASNGTAVAQNVMAYAAIGILSGMFSDRAAAWLLSQSMFDASNDDDANGNGDIDGEGGGDGPIDDQDDVARIEPAADAAEGDGAAPAKE